MKKFVSQVLKFLINLPVKPVSAHCDIPCGIYDPHAAQLAAKTVLTMVQKINQLPKENYTVNDRNSFVRMVSVKEQHAEICKREVLILWTDYFKVEHLEKFPDLHKLVWKTTKLCSDNKRVVDEVKANELIEAVDKIADIFNQTKK
ncbi:MAG: superoxide dismutase, Ni [Candidatus Daviesbacteria bacterium]|nr:superoxide dismutase, Ni [Candidatus Daviesbacteria bacterium]